MINNNKGDNVVFNSKSSNDKDLAKHYKNLIAKVFHDWRPRIGSAPTKNGWDNVFKCAIPSRREVLMARDAMIKDIMDEAKLLGIEVRLGSIEPEPYVSPWDKESA
jgi:hypothetical protein